MESKLDQVFSNVQEYIKNPSEAFFGEVALDLYDLHRTLNPVYKKYDIGSLDDWRRIPLMPISEYKNGDVGLVLDSRMPFPGVEFHSSGTTQRDKSKHRMYDTEAYRLSIAEAFRLYVASSTTPQYRVVLLTPRLPHSSLYYMMSYVAELQDHRGIREEFSDILDEEKVSTLLESLKTEREPVILFGTSLAFYDLTKTMEKLDSEKIELPKGSLMIETGGWKGRDIDLEPRSLTTVVSLLFGIPFMDCIREYSMSELSSQLYAWGNNYYPGYHAPDWLKVRTVDPLTQREITDGEVGVISFVDLANIWSCPFVLTEDLGRYIEQLDGGRILVLEGRVESAPEKGCSLTYIDAVDNKS